MGHFFPKKDDRTTAVTGDLEPTIVLAGHSGAERSLPLEEPSPVEEDCYVLRFDRICDFASGGMGVIGKAKDRSLDRIVAVKSLKEKFRDNPGAVQAFLTECKLNARLDHPAIVPIYALGKNRNGDWEAAMKLINGSSLNEFIISMRKTYDRKKVSMPQERHALFSRLEYFLKICEVIQYCHSMKIVHGDLKPDNILLGQFGELYVMDWGCAQPVGTRPDHIAGTPNYLPPEFLRDKVVSFQNDIFALGMVLFELSTLLRGKSRNPGEAAEKNGKRTHCSVFASSNSFHYCSHLTIPYRLLSIIRKATAPVARERYRTVSELMADVRHFMFDEEISACPDSLAQKLFRWINRNRVKSMVAAVLLMVALLAGWSYSAYRGVVQAKAGEERMVRRLRLQAFTDILNMACAKNFLMGQYKLNMLKDKLTEIAANGAISLPARVGAAGVPKTENMVALSGVPGSVPSDSLSVPPGAYSEMGMKMNMETEMAPETAGDIGEKFAAGRIYDNFEYAAEQTSPAGMEKTPFYPCAVNFSRMVRLKPEILSGEEDRLPSGAKFVDACCKVMRLDAVSLLSRETAPIVDARFSEKSSVQRMIVCWRNGVCYSYPGMYEIPGTVEYRTRYSPVAPGGSSERKMIWGIPYKGKVGHRIQGRKSLFSEDGRYLGEARLELRLEKLLEPMLKANLKDSVHELFFVSPDGTIVEISDGRLTILQRGRRMPGKPSAESIERILKELRKNHMQQLFLTIDGKKYYISGGQLHSIHGWIIQRIEENAMKNHQHVDLTV